MSFRRPGSLYRMGKLTYGMNVSVDGYIVDSNGDFSWSEPDDEVHQFWNDRVGETAVSLYGRKLYELMSAYWPTAEQDPDITPVTAEYARLWLAMPKVVFSQTLSSVDWNSRLERGDVVEVAERLKAETDGILDVAGATLAAPLIRAGLVDEYLVVVSPVAVGSGTPFFPTLDRWVTLDLVENRTFAASGSVLLRFVPSRD
ncbi:deaminase [Nocardia wallacei]|uniref:Deaminase n=2 Tax=Nocardia wallacei TaxID=480035 RepID=A0A7G1KPG0_9NOCA|nr:deaminase [Nocardia wallacei]